MSTSRGFAPNTTRAQAEPTGKVEGKTGYYIRIKLYGHDRTSSAKACEAVALGEHVEENEAFELASADVLAGESDRIVIVKVIGAVCRGVRIER